MTVEDIKRKLRAIPGMDVLLAQDWARPWIERAGRETVKRVINGELTAVRRRMLAGQEEDASPERIREACLGALTEAERPNLRRVVNATGVVIHTNLGRSLMAAEAVRAMERAARGYSNLEYNLAQGVRGQRNVHVEGLVCDLTGAEAAIVVNNNAGAVLLCLIALTAVNSPLMTRFTVSLPGAGRSSSRGASWWRSAAPSACRTSWSSPARSWWRWARRTERTSRTTGPAWGRTRRCS